MPIAQDFARLEPFWVNLDIDGLNANGFGVPSHSPAEQVAKHQAPSKYIRTDWQDKDNNNVPDMADGFASGGGGTASSANQFYPIVVRAGSSIAASGTLQLSYSLSDPNNVQQATTTRQPQLPDIVTYTASGGTDCRIRIWTVDGSGARDLRELQDTGHVIDPAYVYQASALGLSSGTKQVTLYVEGILDRPLLAKPV